MANTRLNGKRVAILATDGVEQVELTEPRKALDEAGAKTTLISPKSGKIKAWQHDHWGDQLEVDLELGSANAANFDALLLPGGVMNPDHLRQDKRAVEFVKEMFQSGKPIAAICHGPWLLVEADVVRDRTVTSWPSLQTDIRNAGGDWVDREVSTDLGLVTSRKPDDIPAFNRKMLEEFSEGLHQRGEQTATSRASGAARTASGGSNLPDQSSRLG
jgi:protease I